MMQNNTKERLIEIVSKTIGIGNRTDKIVGDLIVNGVTIKPCEVYSTVYLIKDGFVELCTVEGIYYTRRGNYVRLRPFHQNFFGNHSIYHKVPISQFGIKVFKTIDEANEVLGKENYSVE